MSVLSMITAGLSQAWNTISMFAVVNSQWLLTTLGFGASTVAVQAAVLAGVALVTLGVIALSVYLGSKVLSKIFGAQGKAKSKFKAGNPNSDSEDSEPEDDAPEQTVADKTAKAVVASQNLIVQAKNIIKARDKAIKGLNALAAEDKMLDQVVALSKAAVQATQAALDSCSTIAQSAGMAAFRAINDLELTQASKDSINEAAKAASTRLKDIKETHLRAQLTLQYATECDINSKKLFAVSEQAGVVYEAAKTPGEPALYQVWSDAAQAVEDSKTKDLPEGNAELIEAWTQAGMAYEASRIDEASREAWQQAYEAFDNDFNAIQGKLTAIENMDIAAVQEALVEEVKPKKPKGKKLGKK